MFWPGEQINRHTHRENLILSTEVASNIFLCQIMGFSTGNGTQLLVTESTRNIWLSRWHGKLFCLTVHVRNNNDSGTASRSKLFTTKGCLMYHWFKNSSNKNHHQQEKKKVSLGWKAENGKKKKT